MLAQVKVQPKLLSESHNNSPKILSGQGQKKKSFERSDRENDIHYYLG